jgi:cyclophilin family peptidyl-prolyl cis-trans isomerase
MKFPRLSLLIACCLSAGLIHAQDADVPKALPMTPEAAAVALEAAKELSPELAAEAKKKAEEAAASAGVSMNKPKAKGSATSSTPNPTDPSVWGKEDIHKLAVMDIKFGGGTETVMFELKPDAAPQTVDNFISNCDSGLYNGLAVHRTIDNYLVQTGDPLTADDSARDRWGTGGEEKSVPAELKLPHKLGAVAMARRGDKVNPERRSNGSQFYFVLGNMSALNGQYSVFGQVVSGLDVLEQLSHMPADSNDCPLERIEVKSIRVVDHKGPLVVTRNAGEGGRKFTKPASAKGPFERFLERVW